jgi:hypothetical protein
MRNDLERRSIGLAALLATLLVTAVGTAQAGPHPPTVNSQDMDIGRKRFAEGVTALKNGRYEDARISFQQSYALKPAPAVLRNLAAAELKTGHYVDAARHFALYLKTTKPSDIDRIDLVEQAFAEAKSHCGMLVVETNLNGAEIGVDGQTIGRTPLSGDPWWVEPGEHVVTAHLDGYDDHRETHSIDAGRTLRVFVTLLPRGLVASSSTSPDSAIAAAGERLASSMEGRSRGPGDDGRDRQFSPPPAYDNGSRVEVVPIAIGGAVTIAGLAAGIGYSLASSANANDRDALLATIPGPSPKCGSGTPYGGSCAQAQDLDDKSASQRTLATAGFVVAGAAGAATLVYWLWPRNSPSQGLIVPAVAPAYAGIQWRSSF